MRRSFLGCYLHIRGNFTMFRGKKTIPEKIFLRKPSGIKPEPPRMVTCNPAALHRCRLRGSGAEILPCFRAWDPAFRLPVSAVTAPGFQKRNRYPIIGYRSRIKGCKHFRASVRASGYEKKCPPGGSGFRRRSPPESPQLAKSARSLNNEEHKKIKIQKRLTLTRNNL